MKKIIVAFLTLFSLSVLVSFQPKSAKVKFREGDILFISNPIGQGQAIQLATKSKYTHVGIILPDSKGKLMVYHAVEPVKKSTIAEFLALSANGKYEQMRFFDTNMVNRESIGVLVTEANKLIGKPYDKAFSWSDMEMYCSEFVWKLYKRAYQIELCPTKKLSEFDLSSPIVKKALKDRYGDNVPLEEKVVSPGDLHDSQMLVKVN